MNLLYINFYLKKHRLNSNNEAAVIARVTVNSKRVEIPLRLTVDPQKWNSAAKKVKGTSYDAIKVNNELSEVEARIIKIHKHLTVHGYPSADNIKDYFLGKEDMQETLLTMFREHNKRFEERVGIGDAAKGSLTKYKTIRKHTEEFLKRYYGGDMPVKNVDPKFIDDFHYWLRVSKKIQHNTTVKYIRGLGKVLRLSKREGKIQVDPTQGYNHSVKNKDAIFLLQDEVDAVAGLNLDNKSLDRVRDFFIFSCYTGLAYSDVRKLMKTDIKPGDDGIDWIEIKRTKTKVTSKIPVLGHAEKIVKKYEHESEITGNGKVFNVPSNQKINEYLKIVLLKAGVEKFATFHSGRHTFATRMISEGIPLQSVSKMLGHSSIKMTEHYAKLLPEKLHSDILKYKERLANRGK